MLVFGLEVVGTFLIHCTLIFGEYRSMDVVASGWREGKMGREWGFGLGHDGNNWTRIWLV